MRDNISSLIEGIYDAALEPSRWADVIIDINDFVGGQACGIFSKNSISKFGVTHYYCGADPHYIQLYPETHCKFDPLATLPAYGRVVSIPDLVPFAEYRRGRFYQEWLRPQGCVDAANVRPRKSKVELPGSAHGSRGQTDGRSGNAAPHFADRAACPSRLADQQGD